MKNIMMAAAALCCMIMSLSSCTNSDNPVETQPQEPEATVNMADAVKLYMVPQSLYEYNTNNILPIYVMVDNSYEENGKTKHYDLSTITDVQIGKYYNKEMFVIDASTLVDYGYIKLTPNLNNQEIQFFLEDLAVTEMYGGIGLTLALTNKKGETVEYPFMTTYVYPTKLDIKKTIKLADLDNKNCYMIDLSAELPSYFDFGKWPLERYNDTVQTDCKNGIWSAKIKEDGNLYITTDGAPSDEGEPGTAVYNFSRRLVGIPNMVVPEGDGLMVNFQINVELTITD